MLNAVLVLLCLVTGGLSVMEETTRFHQPVHEGAGRLPDEYNAVDEDGMKLYGLIRIPAVKPQNVGHCSWKEVCNLEYSGQFEAAFAKYEELMQKCSDRSWLTLASLGRGETAAVILRRTPCGTLVAAKIPVSPLAAGHNAADCAVLKRLGPFLAAPECQGCFPRYFYYSNVTGICYNQYVPSIPMHRFLRSFNVSLPETIDYVKVAFHQAIDAVAILQANGVTHRDLMFKNMLARPSPGENPPFRLTIMDFCWADSKYDPETYSSTSNFLGHFTRPGDWQTNGYDDMYAIACDFGDMFYLRNGAKGGKYRTYCLPDQDRERTDPSKLEYVIWRMTARNRPDRLGDPATLHDMLSAVTSL